MHFLRKPIVCVTFVSLSMLFLFSGTAFSKEKKSAPAKKTEVSSASPSTIAATVNGSAITKAEIDQALKFMLAQNKITTPLPDEERKKAESAVLNQLISMELIYQAGKKLEIKDIDKRVETQITQNRARYPSPEAYDKAMKASGLSEKDLREYARKEIYINNLIDKEIASKVNVSEAEAKKFYDMNKEVVKASHILILVDAKASAEEKKKARERAEAILKRVKGGEDFAEVAKKESGCPSAAQGGDIGYVGKGGQMDSTFVNAVFSLKQGEISQVVETQFGFHIIKVTEKKLAIPETFEEVKQKIISFLKSQKTQAGVSEYVEKLRKDAKIEIKA